MALESSRAVHHVRVLGGDNDGVTQQRAKIEFIAWVRNVTKASRRRGGKQRGEGPQQSRRILLDGEKTGDLVADLPRELTFLEVESALPLLSPLPVAGRAG